MICIGSATRLIPFLHEHSKVYRAEFRLGATSTTDDAEGEITLHPTKLPVTETEIEAVLGEFVGRLNQRPPVYSAVRVAGRRAYHLARNEEAVTLTPRPVDVFRFELVEYQPPFARFEIECGSGTYIRSLARDLGERLKTGALMSNLMRTRIGPFAIDSAAKVNSATPLTGESVAQHLKPLAHGITHVPTLMVAEREAALVRRGIRIPFSDAVRQQVTPAVNQIASLGETAVRSEARIAVVQEGVDLIAVAEIFSDWLQPRTVFSR